MKLRLLNNELQLRVIHPFEGGVVAEALVGEGENSRVAEVLLYTPIDYDPTRNSEACRVGDEGFDSSLREGWWLYRGFVVEVAEPGLATYDEVALRVKHIVVKYEKKQARLRREVEAFENASALPTARREKIPESVQLFVWQRDQGRCVVCGSQERLEFDHIIPVSRGGSSTERNIQLLCETHNRQKRDSIGGADPQPLFPEDSHHSVEPPPTTAERPAKSLSQQPSESAAVPATSKPLEIPAASQEGKQPARQLRPVGSEFLSERLPGKYKVTGYKTNEQGERVERLEFIRLTAEEIKREKANWAHSRIADIPAETRAKTKEWLITNREIMVKADPDLAKAMTEWINDLADPLSPYWEMRNVVHAVNSHRYPIKASSAEEDTARLDRASARKLVARGNTFIRKRDYDKAIADYTEAIRLDPKYASAYSSRGDSRRKKGEYDRAIADYSEAIRLDPDDADVYNSRGDTYNAQREYGRAIADYTEAIRLNPNLAVAYFSRGEAYHNKGEYDKAITDYTEAIRLDPKYARAYWRRGYAYRNNRDNDKAIADYTDAIALEPNDADVYYFRGSPMAIGANLTRPSPTTPTPSGWTRTSSWRIAAVP